MDFLHAYNEQATTVAHTLAVSAVAETAPNDLTDSATAETAPNNLTDSEYFDYIKHQALAAITAALIDPTDASTVLTVIQDAIVIIASTLSDPIIYQAAHMVVRVINDIAELTYYKATRAVLVAAKGIIMAVQATCPIAIKEALAFTLMALKDVDEALMDFKLVINNLHLLRDNQRLVIFASADMHFNMHIQYFIKKDGCIYMEEIKKFIEDIPHLSVWTYYLNPTCNVKVFYQDYASTLYGRCLL